MRILSPRGRIYNIDKVVPLIEKKEYFNDRVSVNREPVTSLALKPTAVKFIINHENNLFNKDVIVIGNLKPDVIKEMLSSLLVDGYYDFSGFTYQKVNLVDVKKIKLDGGISLPYYEEDSNDNCYFGNVPKFLPHDYDEVSEQDDFESDEDTDDGLDIED